ncbi:NAD(P)/FAD-dependent oxidoreductase [Anaerobutyricum hallii]|uniref:NAD(P)/FAD-dependent oxidoreductase n=1 Tax=Anaerobutyricum hallii TaxID=39488 RepID=UPI00201AC130|nr:NAD(P)/FAD-dependent oxidoreductase [Anaerobutyricum hallii]
MIDVGHFVAEDAKIKNVVSEMTVKGLTITPQDYASMAKEGRKKGIIQKTDVVIIGAGVIGCGIARELSKYDFHCIVVDKENDVSVGASKANNGNIHPGHAVKKGTLKHKLNILGNRMYDEWAKDLQFEFQRNGLMYIAWEEEYLPALKRRYTKGLENGVDGIRYISGEEAMAIEPELKKLDNPPIAAVWLPSLAHVEPYEVTIALAENAAENQVKFMLNTKVCDIVHDGRIQAVVTSRGVIETKYVINAAGVYADDISRMAGDVSYTIHPRKGTIVLLDKAKTYPYKPQLGFVSNKLENRMMNVKNKESKGGGCCKTPEGNYLLGPSAKEVWNKEDTSCDAEGIAYALSCCQHKGVGEKDVIRSFAGVRAADFKEDFIIEKSEVTSGLIHVAGIQSPGLSAAPAIAKMVENILLEEMKKEGMSYKRKKNYQPYRPKRRVFRKLSLEEQNKLIKENPDYGQIVCRCEFITKGEILDAIDSPVVPTSVDAIKRRTRAGMGRCQGGFCLPVVLQILAQAQQQDCTEIDFTAKDTNILEKIKN